MRTIAVAFRYLWSRPLAALLNLFLLTLGLASITFVVLVSHQVNNAFERDLSGIDAVVGAKGSPLQLIMAGVFQLDVPPGSILLADVQKLAQHPQVNKVIPMALGDTFKGFRIVGTTAAYMDHYRVRVAQGELWRKPMHAVIGADVARSTGLAPGNSFSGSHGLATGGNNHDESPYQVMGVLAPCNCVLDRLILTTMESVWRVHEKEPKTAEATAAPALATTGPEAAPVEGLQMSPMLQSAPVEREPDREVTMALVTYKTPQAAATFPRYVNSQTTMQAAAPTVEVSRLLRLLGVGTEVLRGLGAVLLLTAALSVFIALWNAVRERREDHAMLRMLGATPAKVSALLVCEAVWLALLASALGLAAGHALTEVVGGLLQAQQSLPVTGFVWVPGEWWIPLSALVVAGIAALIPAITAYRVDVAQLLNGR